ncbi:hypothetical protein SAMN04488114_11542 [Carnobacterium iners]|nr:hypothetical protein SAMN04488114_11542 [Carnobacterium iners]
MDYGGRGISYWFPYTKRCESTKINGGNTSYQRVLICTKIPKDARVPKYQFNYTLSCIKFSKYFFILAVTAVRSTITGVLVRIKSE